MKSELPAWFKTPAHADSQQQAVVIGGGIAGAQIAWHLAQQDWKVLLIERHAKLATEASGNKAAAVSPKMTAQSSLGESFYASCFAYAYQQFNRLKEQNPTLSWHQCGAMQINHNDRESQRWNALKSRQLPSDFLQCLSADQASDIAGIRLDKGASYFPQGGWLNPASLCQALCSHPNIEVQTNTSALALKQTENQPKKWHIFDEQHKLLASSNTIIIANGKDAGAFQQTRFLPFVKILGQTSQASATNTSAQLKTVIGHEGYLTPEHKGKHIFGATFERDHSKAEINRKADQINYQQLHKHLPEFADQLGKIQSSHAAIRMVTPDRFPYVGALPDTSFYQKNYADLSKGKHWKQYPDAEYQQGLFLFAGHASRGVTTTGLCASYLTSLITNQGFHHFDQPLKNALHPARFLIRELKRQQTETVKIT